MVRPRFRLGIGLGLGLGVGLRTRKNRQKCRIGPTVLSRPKCPSSVCLLLLRTLIDIAATVKQHSKIVANLLAMHCLSGCDTVAQLFGIGRGSSLKTLKAGRSLNKLGCLHIPLAEVISEAMVQCYDSKKELMSDVRVEMWGKRCQRNV